jgi:SAM-dependent methyltransferase
VSSAAAKELIRALPRLSADAPLRDLRQCKLCGVPSRFFDAVDFSKICNEIDFYYYGLSGVIVPYWRCRVCDLIFTDFFDDWSREDWSRLVYNDDYVLVDGDYLEKRPAEFASHMARRFQLHKRVRMLDYGSGRGVFAERMKQLGFEHAESYDPFSSPRRPEGSFDVITCFEVLEHTPNPLLTLADIKQFLAPGGYIIFSQTIQPANITQLRANWWYIAPRNGHISVYSRRTLAQLAERTGLVLRGRDGIFALTTTIPSKLVTETAEDFGPPLIARDFFAPPLCAPGKAGPVPLEWHGVEKGKDCSFRCSASGELQWPLPPLPLYPCELMVSIPFVMCAYPQILDGALLRAGETSVPVTIDAHTIHGTLVVSSVGVQDLKLTTQEPRSPAELRGGADRRKLGVAVRLTASSS